ncbi:MAG TPA: Rap1a/Tai family immunity protein [Woeseiaceae bacterium]|nr:Rap1a/Tai family immunity protein [Woeseiaceae bacterium]
MTLRLSWCAIGIVMISAAASDARAVEALSTEELISHCAVYEQDPEGEDGVFCVRYIQGFIDGAVVTDERVTYNVADEYDREETFTERAIRTRLGTRLDRYGPSYYAEFCLGEPLPLAEVARVVIADLLQIEDLKGRELAREVVYETLRREFPCDADDE